MTDTDTHDARLGALLEHYQDLRALDPTATVDRLQAEAGDLYPEFAELAACLDTFDSAPRRRGAAQPSAPEPDGRPSAPEPDGRRRAVGIAFGLLVLISGGVWIMARGPTPARLEVVTHPLAKVEINGNPYDGELFVAGTLRVHAEQVGFEPAAATVTIDGTDTRLTLHLAPRDPFDPVRVEIIAASYGIEENAATTALPRPVGINTVSEAQVQAALEIANPEALHRELERYPEAVRRRPDIQHLASRQLFRATLYAESYAMARELADAYPHHPETWKHCARALWGLELVESALYREILERYDAALAGQ